MIHDRDLLDRLSAHAPIRFDGAVFRAARLGLDPLTPSLSGGRWALKTSDTVDWIAWAKLQHFLPEPEPTEGVGRSA